jgi:DNA topoisomerase-1
VTSADVNAYLREITGQDITAKDFRTWAGTVLAALALQEFEAFDSEAKAKKNLRAAIEGVAARLGNTPTICRKCYIHPQVLDCYLEGALLLQIKDAVEDELRADLTALKPEEAAVLGLLQARLAEVKDGKGRDLSAGAKKVVEAKAGTSKGKTSKGKISKGETSKGKTSKSKTSKDRTARASAPEVGHAV